VKQTSSRHFAILITGLPASGKTTLAKRLVDLLGLPLFSRDIIKEAIFESIGEGDIVSPKMLGIASTGVIWSLLKDCPNGALIETWINPIRDDTSAVRSALEHSGVEVVYEIFCQCPADIAVRRYAARKRSEVHRGNDRVLQDIRDVAPFMKPLGIGLTLTVDTSRPVNLEHVTSWWRSVRE
jgi:adenylate kinase family enzyme